MRRRVILAGLVAAVVAPPRPAGAAPPARAPIPSPAPGPAALPPLAAAEALLREAGVAATLATLRDDAARTAAEAGRAFGPGGEAAWRAALAGRFDPDAMTRAAARSLSAELTPEEVHRLRARWRRPDIRRIVAAETAALTPEGRALRDAHGARLLSALAAERPARFDLLRRLEAATGATDLSVALAAGFGHALLEGAAETGRLAQADAGALRALALQQAGARRDALMAAVFVEFAFAYQSVPDRELEDYIACLEGPQGGAFHRAAAAAVAAAATAEARAFGRALALRLGERGA